MKTLTFTRNVFAILIVAICCLFSFKMAAQTIRVDSTFTKDGEIFPFSPNDTIYGLSISGHVTLSSDTSLVRVILTDNSGNEWVVYEAYPMIVDSLDFDVEEECDETCFLEECKPYSISIQIIASRIDISSLSCMLIRYENLAQLQRQAKRSKDLDKVQLMNQYIVEKGWEWIADTTGFVTIFYQEKSQFFHHKYNLLGLDYYSAGVYYSAAYDCILPYTESTIIQSFDWRKKHNANLPNPLNYYYGGESGELDNGWMTGIRLQECGSCQSFATIASLEAAINLYENYQFDIHEGIRFSARDAFNCSYYLGGVGCYCGDDPPSDGKGISAIMTKLKDEGVVNEACYPWPDSEYPNFCESNNNVHENCNFSHKCENPAMTAKICTEKTFDLSDKSGQPEKAAYLKELLIKNGPLTITLHYWPDDKSADHAVCLVGFDTDKNGNIVWIFKNSWGLLSRWGDAGYGKQAFWLGSQVSSNCTDPMIMNTIHAIDYDISCSPPIILNEDPDIFPDFKYEVQDVDKDFDGYHNWGIGRRPDNSYYCGLYVENEEMEDSNDDDNRIGPYEPDYSGRPVKPQMIVTIGTSNVPVTNHGFYFIPVQNNQNFNIWISNPGNAQLNLADDTPVTINSEISGEFSLLFNNQPDSKICMGDQSSFQVHFETTEPGEVHTAQVKIQLNDCDHDIYDEFEFQLVYNGCNLTGQDYHVTGYKRYDGYNLIPNDIYIDPRGTMEVFGSLAMFPQSDIFVQPGGHLIINGGLVTGTTGICTNLWHGIDVWGASNQTQSLDYQGWVSVINGGTIEYAEIAIETAIHSRSGAFYPTGGIVSCFDAIFKDNITDVHLYPFTNRQSKDGQILPNFSRFSRTLFKTTSDLYTRSHEPSSHLYMDQVEGIYIMGCTFANYSPFMINTARGKGIESYGAGYFVFRTCAQDGVFPCPEIQPCRFENLEYGIQAFNNNSFYTIKVDSADFMNNLRGIYLGLVNNPTVIRSTFDISDPEHLWPQAPLVGLYLDEATTGFQVEENKFEGESTNSQTLTYGVYLLNVDTTYNEIYNNEFVKLRRGIQTVGDNRNGDKGNGVCLKCNDFTDCQADIFVIYDEDENGHIITENTGIAFFQGTDGDGGDPALAAGNRFSSNPAGYNFINYDGCRHIEYTYQAGVSSPPSLVPEYYGDLHLNRDEHATYSTETSCPSHLGGGINLSLEMNSLTEETETIASYQDSLSMLIDGGNTYGLNLDVLTSFPDEALALRQELLDESPYLSDTVMISAIEKEDVLQGAMVRDILVQNPQAPKSNKVLKALDDRQDSIPDYMMEEIMEGLITYGAKEIHEQKLGGHMADRDRAWKNINLYYKNDTANVGAATDSLMEIYSDANMLSAKYALAMMYLDQGDSVHAFTVVNNIPAEFNLSAHELSIHDRYQDLFNILWDIKNDTTGLDSLQIQTLSELSCDKHSIPGLFAANLLIKDDELSYNEPVIFVEITKSAPITGKSNDIGKTNKNLVIFPNPAGNYFIVEYDLPDPDNPGILTISDLHGKKLQVFTLNDAHNQIVIPAQQLSTGNYMICLINGNQIIGSQKLTISK